MDFSLTGEQRALQDTARSWLAAHTPDVGSEAVGGLWSQLDLLGWFGPELDVVDLAVLAEQAGAALLPGPWFATAGLAAPAYRAAGRWPERPATVAWAEPPPGPATLAEAATSTDCRAEHTRGSVRLSGVKRWVADVEADVVVVARGPDGIGLYRVDAAAQPDTVRRLDSMDASRPLADLRLAGTEAELLVGPPRAVAVLRQIRGRAGALLAAEAIGVAQQALDIAAAYARTRTQFGRPIGAYQGVSHRLADVAACVELARSLAYRAAWCVRESAPDSAGALAMAAVATREAALSSCAAAVQTLGGIGFTWEHPVHRLFRRASWLAGFDGTPGGYRAELGESLLDGPGPLR